MTTAWKFFRNLHLIASVIFGLFAVAVGLSGSALVFREEIEHALYEPRIEPAQAAVPFAALMEKAATLDPARRVSLMVLPIASDRSVEFIIQKRDARTLKDADQMSVYVNPYTGELINSRRREASFIAKLRDLHFAFFSGTPGLTFNGYVALALVFMSFTGLFLWTVASPKKQRFKLSFRGSWKSVVWNMHRQMGVLSLMALILVALTGAYYAFREPFQKAIQAATGTLPPRGTPAVSVPSDGALPHTIDEIAAAARAAFPSATLAVLRIPSQKTQTWAATFHRPGDSGESTDSGPTIFMDPYTLNVTRVDDAATMPLGARLVKSMEPLHYGKFGGIPIQILWVGLGLLPLFFSISGALMWWNRTGGFKSKKRTLA